MITKKQFDSLIKKNYEEFMGKDVFGYELPHKTYEDYFKKSVFQDFCKEMETCYPKAYDKYYNGKGNELGRETERPELNPPKMASVASSSRFCYLALRDGAKAIGGSGEVEFECECRITGVSGTAPQMDAYIANENIYVEVKCHEIFDSHKLEMSSQYWDLIYGEKNQFGFLSQQKIDGNMFKVSLKDFDINTPNTLFDIKQFLCHLLGIASNRNKESVKRDATLVYLFFKPKTKNDKEQKEINSVFDKLQEEINLIFNSEPIRKFTEKNHICLNAVVEYAEVMGALNKSSIVTLLKNKL